MPVRGRHQREAEARLAMIGQNADILAGRAGLPARPTGRPGDHDQPYDDIPDAIDEAAAEFTPAECWLT